MIEFFTFSWGGRIAITFILGLCVLAQTLSIVLNFYRFDQTIRRVFEILLEFFILCEIIMLSFMHGEVINGYNNGIVVAIGYENIRISIFLSILMVAIIVCYIKRTLLPISVIVFAGISLPAIENIMGSLFPWLFVGALVFFLVRGVKNSISNYFAIKTNISALSIINALDTLHTGVIFSESDGYIVLSNHQMQRLMLLITGKIFRNSLKFYEVLISDKYESRYKKVGIEGQTVYLLSDETAWMFTKTDIPFLRKNYVHISAADVSENWALTSKLQAQEEELREKTLELKATISNLHILSKEKEIENAKVRAHDIIGQRLTVLLRMLQNRDNLDYGSLTSLSKGLLEELKEEEIETKAEDELKKIQQIFNIIGVEVIFQGQLPHDEEDAQLFVDIIREGTANAVRHGFATQVKVEAEESEGSYNLVVANIGYTRDEPITLGSGLKAMRKKVNDQGGRLEIIHYPVFTLSVCLPGGEKSG